MRDNIEQAIALEESMLKVQILELKKDLTAFEQYKDYPSTNEDIISRMSANINQAYARVHTIKRLKEVIDRTDNPEEPSTEFY